MRKLLVSDRDQDFEVEAIANPAGYIRVHCHEVSAEWPSLMPRMTPEEARALAAELIAAADLADMRLTEVES